MVRVPKLRDAILDQASADHFVPEHADADGNVTVLLVGVGPESLTMGYSRFHPLFPFSRLFFS